MAHRLTPAKSSPTGSQPLYKLTADQLQEIISEVTTRQGTSPATSSIRGRGRGQVPTTRGKYIPVGMNTTPEFKPQGGRGKPVAPSTVVTPPLFRPKPAASAVGPVSHAIKEHQKAPV